MENARILMVEDNPGDAHLIELMLGGHYGNAFTAINVSTLSEAISILNDQTFDIILLDLSLPDSTGMDNITKIKQNSPSTPIIVMTGRTDDEFALETVKEGAQDYLVKNELEPRQLSRSIRYSMERKKLQEEMAILANYDFLTGLANRALFKERFERILTRCKRSNDSFALLYLDLDYFKSVNDALGHDIGDMLLVEVAKRLKAAIRESDTVARLGGDEFAILLESVQSQQIVSSIAEKILQSIALPLNIEEHLLHIGFSVGIAMYPSAGTNIKDLSKNADSALYRAKEDGRGRFCYFTTDMKNTALEQLETENDLRIAIKEQQFELYFQPKFNIVEQRIDGTEALIRWNHPEKGLILPQHFIPLLENSGLIKEVGKWVALTACEQQQKWVEQGIDCGTLSINLSGRQLINNDFRKYLKAILEKTGLPAKSIEIELTETLLIEETENSINALNSIRDLGVSIAIDDFGTGYCSFPYLRKFAVDTLKIDQSFVKNIDTDTTDSAIISSIIELGKKLKIKIIAEGVEHQRQLDYLFKNNAINIQGYLISPPLPAKAMTELFEKLNK